MPEARRLVTDGLYTYIRHPLYLGEFIAQTGIFLQFRSWPAAILLGTQFFFQFRRMCWEESILGQAFFEYAEYRENSWRLIPGVY
jgi:protein-S-isoprenylcysteine O-methyltransferase Ste14